MYFLYVGNLKTSPQNINFNQLYLLAYVSDNKKDTKSTYFFHACNDIISDADPWPMTRDPWTHHPIWKNAWCLPSIPYWIQYHTPYQSGSDIVSLPDYLQGSFSHSLMLLSDRCLTAWLPACSVLSDFWSAVGCSPDREARQGRQVMGGWKQFVVLSDSCWNPPDICLTAAWNLPDILMTSS